MTNYQKFEFLAAQFFAGLGFAIPGAIITSLVLEVIYDLRDIHIDPFGSFMFLYIGAYLGTLIGVWYISYALLKQKGLNLIIKFPIHALQSIVGLTLGFILPYIIANPINSYVWTPYSINKFWVILFSPFQFSPSISIFLTFVPLIGSILGFNFRLFKNISLVKSDKKTLSELS